MKEVTFEDYRERILRVLVHIQQSLDEPLSLDELAAVACFSPFHFHRIFRGLVGESVKEHVRRLRLERAAQRLRFTGQPVIEIAFDAGYQAPESFARAFHQMFGQSPTEFRVTRRTVAYGPAPSGVHFATEGKLDGFRPADRARSLLLVRVRELPSLRVAFARHVGPYEQVSAAWSRLMTWAGRRGLFSLPVKTFGILHDDPEVTAPDKLRYEAAMVVAEEVAAEGEVGIQQITGGRYAVATHAGPYEQVGDTYARLCGEWLPLSGRELLSAPALEFYRNSPEHTPPEELLTDVWLPLA
ncbi:MAG TPA: AraC family transcriptional regulator [Blastocatellia bacterium]|nr:AraC family transcriptional regulator [Blastocatellia bacterium]